MEMTGPIELDTERLRLRQWCTADREPFAALNADPKVMEFFLRYLHAQKVTRWLIVAKHLSPSAVGVSGP
jgi:RimJ/RimL family protein N-acetyltransferase